MRTPDFFAIFALIAFALIFAIIGGAMGCAAGGLAKWIAAAVFGV